MTASAAKSGGNNNEARFMGRIFKAVLVLALLGFVGLSAFAYLADLSPTQTEMKVPVTLNGN